MIIDHLHSLHYLQSQGLLEVLSVLPHLWNDVMKPNRKQHAMKQYNRLLRHNVFPAKVSKATVIHLGLSSSLSASRMAVTMSRFVGRGTLLSNNTTPEPGGPVIDTRGDLLVSWTRLWKLADE